MKELTHEQLSCLLTCRVPQRLPKYLREPLADAGLVSGHGGQSSTLTPRGRALVDVALRAVNAELAGERRDVCWHCGDVLVMRHEPPRCEWCPAFGECCEGDCREPGCAELAKEAD